MLLINFFSTFSVQLFNSMYFGLDNFCRIWPASLHRDKKYRWYGYPTAALRVRIAILSLVVSKIVYLLSVNLYQLPYRLSATPLMYPASLVFDVPSSAFVGLACGNLFIGVITTISSFVLQLFDDEVLGSDDLALI